MSLNRLGDLGVQPLLKALSKNSTLVTLDISSNHLGEPSAHSLAEVSSTENGGEGGGGRRAPCLYINSTYPW